MQHILITGGNAGIGKATAMVLAQKGAKIILACRDNNKAKEAVNEIKETTGNKEIYNLECDLSSLDSIRNGIRYYRKQFDKLDILINNAGLVTDKLQFTKDGYELQFGVNHLGHFLLTIELIDLLKESKKGRIINVSSNAHYKGEINFNSLKGEIDLSKTKGMAFYSQSKLANVIFTKELARRYPAICSHSLTPGIVNTQIAQKNGNKILWKIVWNLFSIFMKTPEKGARTSIYLAQSEEPLKTNGKYFYKEREIEASTLANDKELAKKLWDISHQLVNSTGVNHKSKKENDL